MALQLTAISLSFHSARRALSLSEGDTDSLAPSVSLGVFILWLCLLEMRNFLWILQR